MAAAVTSTRTSPTRVSEAGTSTGTSADMASSTAVLPSTPAMAAAPSEAATHRITAPVEAGAIPCGVIPAIVPTPEKKLGLLNIAGRFDQTAHGHRHGWRSQHRNTQRNSSADQFSLHKKLPELRTSPCVHCFNSTIIVTRKPAEVRHFRIGSLRLITSQESECGSVFKFPSPQLARGRSISAERPLCRIPAWKASAPPHCSMLDRDG